MRVVIVEAGSTSVFTKDRVGGQYLMGFKPEPDDIVIAGFSPYGFTALQAPEGTEVVHVRDRWDRSAKRRKEVTTTDQLGLWTNPKGNTGDYDPPEPV